MWLWMAGCSLVPGWQSPDDRQAHRSCDAYLDCLQTWDASAGVAASALYGDNGTCWSSGGTELCAAACRDSLHDIADLTVGIEACNPHAPQSCQAADEDFFEAQYAERVCSELWTCSELPCGRPTPSLPTYRGCDYDPLLACRCLDGGSWTCDEVDPVLSLPVAPICDLVYDCFDAVVTDDHLSWLRFREEVPDGCEVDSPVELTLWFEAITRQVFPLRLEDAATGDVLDLDGCTWFDAQRTTVTCPATDGDAGSFEDQTYVLHRAVLGPDPSEGELVLDVWRTVCDGGEPTRVHYEIL